MVEYLPIIHICIALETYTQKKLIFFRPLLSLLSVCSTKVRSITSCVLGNHSTLEFYLAFHCFIFIGIEEMMSS